MKLTPSHHTSVPQLYPLCLMLQDYNLIYPYLHTKLESDGSKRLRCVSAQYNVYKYGIFQKSRGKDLSICNMKGGEASAYLDRLGPICPYNQVCMS